MFSAYEYNSPPELRSFPLVQGVSSIYNLLFNFVKLSPKGLNLPAAGRYD